MSTTDDTRQRSIPDILGWEFRCLGRSVSYDDQGRPVDSRAAGYWCPPGVAYSDGSPPNVDDMLAWLRDQGRLSHEVWYNDSGQVGLRTEYKSTHDHFSAPTLHAALEAAVRAVAEVSGGE